MTGDEHRAAAAAAAERFSMDAPSRAVVHALLAIDERLAPPMTDLAAERAPGTISREEVDLLEWATAHSAEHHCNPAQRRQIDAALARLRGEDPDDA